jgi:hypothetical protein
MVQSFEFLVFLSNYLGLHNKFMDSTFKILQLVDDFQLLSQSVDIFLGHGLR